MSINSRTDNPALLGGDSGFDRHAIRRELAGSLTVLVGLFLLVCLIAGTNQNAVGVVGARIRDVLQLVFGLPISFVVPAAVIWMGVETFLGKARRWSPLRIFGVFFMIWALTGLLALPGAGLEEVREETFSRAGVLGVFLVEGQGVGLVGKLGTVGAALVMSGLLMIGLVMTTNSGLTALVARIRHRERAEKPVEAPPEPAPKSKASTAKRPRPTPPPEPDEEEDDDEEHDPSQNRVAKPSIWSRMFTRRPRPKADTDRARILCPADDPTGWDDPLDADVAAAARALEKHEWESRLRGRLRIGQEEAATWDGEPEEEYDDEEFDVEEEYEEDELDEEIEEGEDEQEDEIVFMDHSGPLPVASENPANAKVGEGLAKLFPNRWPKEGTPAGAIEEEDELDEPQDPASEDPLFASDYDTRPHGPNGQPVEREEAEPEAPVYNPEDYLMPEISLLADPPQVDARMTREEVFEMSNTLIQTLADFGVEGKVTEVHQGPVVTRFEFRPAPGIKVSRITGLEHDIAMAMRALNVRILAPIPGKNAVGIEVPNKKRQGVYLKELISCGDFWENQNALGFALGKTIDGTPYFADLAKMPHLLIAGATGAGKSVCLNTIIASLLYRNRPDQVKFIMVDPKRVELSVYADIPHLLAPVVCEPKAAAAALDWAVEQMEERYKKLVELGVRNIDGYNRVVANPDNHRRARGKNLEPMPYMVIIVDELADLMLVARADVEESIQRLAQMARAVGIHLILATQRPSVNVITGIIKANFPSRIAFQVSQKVDSRTILDMNGAEALLGRGDMLFSKGGANKPIRIQGAFVSDDEVESMADHCRTQMPVRYEVEEFEPKLSEKEQRELARMMGDPDMDDLEAQDRIVRGTNRTMGKVHAGMFVPHDGGSARAGDEEIDEALVRAAARLILESEKASVSLLQRRLKVGFARAGRLMDMLEEMGIVGEFKGSKPRDIIVDCAAALGELNKLESALAAGQSVEDIVDDPAVDEAEHDEFDVDDPEAPWPKEMRG